MPAAKKQHLIGAAGLFWNRDEVEWKPGNGNSWQMLGVLGKRSPKLQVCDFRTARGFYVLYNHHGPVYVGLARGSQGRLGNRLREHTSDHLKEQWQRFSWFSFDDVEPDPKMPAWSRVVHDDNLRHIGAETATAEFEALMIQAFGLRQNQMKFQRGQLWEQATWRDCYPDGRLPRVRARIVTPQLRDAIDSFAEYDG